MTSPKPWVSPIEAIPFDFDGLCKAEKALLAFNKIPDLDNLRKPHQKKKVKNFPDEAPSWKFTDAWQSGAGISLNDVIAAIKKQPYDADLWGLLPVFDISSELKIEFLRRGVAAGEVYLGKAMKDEVGHFWSLLATRPYMRCMNLLYRELVKAMKPSLAAPIGRKMLELCPNDNIGIRFSIDEVEKSIKDKELAAELAELFADQDVEAQV